MASSITSPAADRQRHLYERDYYSWTLAQARALRSRKVEQLDWEKLAEEVEDLGRSERRELRNRIKVLLAHLLKWRFQPKRRTRSWRVTIGVQRIEIRRVLRENPGLKSAVTDLLAQAYEVARLEVEGRAAPAENVHPPQSCPWTFERILREDFWPEGS